MGHTPVGLAFCCIPYTNGGEVIDNDINCRDNSKHFSFSKVLNNEWKKIHYEQLIITQNLYFCLRKS